MQQTGENLSNPLVKTGKKVYDETRIQRFQ
ncbi:hypothetical protein A33I_11850 [Alkalihalophilus marmarensis DSM 21297]|uniref:Uncharacterized protein n=1 Tax=Alkalihalophilus marmarensis DSM 21297 TaxID=1188261 RepID=U6SPQ3_9BACI|nr:hypothetical protein A33I_11850 [Alkalihalophilus marmarensis DSM 21297]